VEDKKQSRLAIIIPKGGLEEHACTLPSFGTRMPVTLVAGCLWFGGVIKELRSGGQGQNNNKKR